MSKPITELKLDDIKAIAGGVVTISTATYSVTATATSASMLKLPTTEMRKR